MNCRLDLNEILYTHSSLQGYDITEIKEMRP